VKRGLLREFLTDHRQGYFYTAYGPEARTVVRAGEDVPAPSVASPMTASGTGVVPNVPFVVAVGASVPLSR
jgi:hypothetical protein